MPEQTQTSAFPVGHPLLDEAIETVAAACEIARAVQRDLERVRQITKDDRSPVTVADFAVQAIVHLGLAGNGDGALHIVGEESAAALRDPSQAAVLDAVVKAVATYRPGISRDEVLSAIDACDHDATGEAYWALDPVDGTKGFLRGQQYAIALARIERGKVVLGVMGCPNLPSDQSRPLDVADATGSLYAAIRGQGAWEIETSKEAVVSSARRLRTASHTGLIRVCESVEAGHSKRDDTQRIVAELGGAGEPARLDSQCKYAVVARGQADAYLRLPTKKGYIEKVWDHAAGAIIATEAGAIVTDIIGSELDFACGPTLKNNRGIVCATRAVHERIIEAIEKLEIAAVA